MSEETLELKPSILPPQYPSKFYSFDRSSGVKYEVKTGERSESSSITAVPSLRPYDAEGQQTDGGHGIPDCPDGGTQAWLVVLGGFLTYFATFGYLNSFGTYQAYYTEDLLSYRTPSDIAWIGSIQLFFLFFGGMIFGPMFDAYGAKILFIPGTLIYVASFMFQSLSKEYYQLMLSQGIMFGIGDAMLFYPTISSVSHWFDRRRGLALGIVVAGSSLGGVAWPILIEALIKRINYAWAVRISGFICLAFLVPSIFMVRGRLPPNKGKQADGGINGQVIKDIFKDGRYTWFVGGTFLVFWGMFIPFYYLPDYGKSHGMTATEANYLLAYLNAGSLVGRVLSGLLADKLGRFNISFLCALFSSVLLLALHRMDKPSSIIAFSVLYGFLSGGLISLQSACVSQITSNIAQVGLKIGLMMALCSLVALTGPPIAGAILTWHQKDGEQHNSPLYWDGLINFAGVIMIVGSAAVGWSRLKVKMGWRARV
ncbi:major facilitator superfamily domain-containing protein [Kalaharituber pfeilii]|nr:major facilitator superfamily domain-containing protein [Kalaharituber pfeilii]